MLQPRVKPAQENLMEVKDAWEKCYLTSWDLFKNTSRNIIFRNWISVYQIYYLTQKTSLSPHYHEEKWWKIDQESIQQDWVAFMSQPCWV